MAGAFCVLWTRLVFVDWQAIVLVHSNAICFICICFICMFKITVLSCTFANL